MCVCVCVATAELSDDVALQSELSARNTTLKEVVAKLQTQESQWTAYAGELATYHHEVRLMDVCMTVRHISS